MPDLVQYSLYIVHIGSFKMCKFSWFSSCTFPPQKLSCPRMILLPVYTAVDVICNPWLHCIVPPYHKTTKCSWHVSHCTSVFYSKYTASGSNAFPISLAQFDNLPWLASHIMVGSHNSVTTTRSHFTDILVNWIIHLLSVFVFNDRARSWPVATTVDKQFTVIMLQYWWSVLVEG